ncbi:MAG: glycerol-3-phosphate dehydrogenase [Campylobacteraceae bacterium 4484_166]|nr:MAG: glycerol-3-phosphate dehydrogenase [Campylobacteraceae bacterium 4484_166]
MSQKSIAVIGAGKWGQAIHFAISKQQKCLITNRTKKNIKNFVSLEEALSCEYLIITVPTQAVGQWLKSSFKNNNQKIVVASKGIEAKSGRFLKEIYEAFVKPDNLGFLSGPSFASEVMQSLPTAIVINSTNKQLYDEFKDFFPPNIKCYYSDDIIGAEVAGAYKNVLAIASGICDGLKLGNNARAALISRGLVEMRRFGNHFGAKDETFIGLSGAGDLFLTASSSLSRNYRVGLGISNNKTIDTIIKELGEIAEGIMTCKAITKLSKKFEIYCPIVWEVALMIDGKSPQQSLNDLLKS